MGNRTEVSAHEGCTEGIDGCTAGIGSEAAGTSAAEADGGGCGGASSADGKAQQDATAHESEVKTKVKDALKTFDALEEAEKALRQAEEADAKAKANAESAKKALDDFKKQEDAWRKQEAELQGVEAAYEVCKQQNQQYRDLKKSLEDLHGNQKDVQEKARQAAAAKDAYASATQNISGHRMNMMIIAWRS